ncbi:hypothetical protein MASR1M45_05740 [Candidatus Kapaibacterium sp.]
MISALTGLPELVLDKQNDAKLDIDFGKKQNNGSTELSALKSDSKPKIEQKDKKFNQESIDELNKELNSFLEGNKLNAEFKFEKESNQLVMKLIDNETKEVVRQVPPEFMLKIARLISSQLEGGALADAKV